MDRSLRAALTNIVGSGVLSQSIVLASTPLLTRRFDQAEFGQFGVATLVALLVSTFLSCRLEQSLHAVAAEPARLFAAVIWLIGLLAGVVGLPIALGYLWSQDANGVFVLVFAASLAVTVAGTLMLNRQARFSAIALVTVLQPLVMVLGAGFGPRWPGEANTLLAWQAASHGASAALALWLLKDSLSRVGPACLLEQLRVHRDDVRYLVPATLLSIASLNLSVLGAALLYDARVAGLVVIAQRIARAPVTVIANTLNEVLRSAIPAPHALAAAFRLVLGLSLATSMLMMAVVSVVPDAWYEAVLGDSWDGLASIMVITVFGATFQLVASSIRCLLSVLRKRSELIINAALFGIGALSVGLAAVLKLSPEAYLWTSAAASALVFIAAGLQSRVAMQEHQRLAAETVPTTS